MRAGTVLLMAPSCMGHCRARGIVVHGAPSCARHRGAWGTVKHAQAPSCAHGLVGREGITLSVVGEICHDREILVMTEKLLKVCRDREFFVVTKLFCLARASTGYAPRACRHAPARAMLFFMASFVATMKSSVVTELHCLRLVLVSMLHPVS